MVVLLLEVLLSAVTLIKRNLRHTILHNTDAFAFGGYLGLVTLIFLPSGIQGTQLGAQVFLITLFVTAVILFTIRYRPQAATTNPTRLVYLIAMGATLFWLYHQNPFLAVAAFIVFLLLNAGVFHRKSVWETMRGNRALIYFFATGPLIGLLVGYAMLETISTLLMLPLGYFVAYLLVQMQDDLLQLKRNGGLLFFLLGALYAFTIFMRFGI